MKNNYSVEEILNAVDELQKIKKKEKIISDKKSSKIDNLSCLLYTSPSPRDGLLSRMPSSA